MNWCRSVASVIAASAVGVAFVPSSAKSAPVVMLCEGITGSVQYCNFDSTYCPGCTASSNAHVSDGIECDPCAVSGTLTLFCPGGNKIDPAPMNLACGGRAFLTLDCDPLGPGIGCAYNVAVLLRCSQCQ